MIHPFLTGDLERDARHLSRKFRAVGFTLEQWRQVVRETNEARTIRADDLAAATA